MTGPKRPRGRRGLRPASRPNCRLHRNGSTQALPPLAQLRARRSEWGNDDGLRFVLDVSGDEGGLGVASG